MADEHSFPGRLETKVMIPFPCSVYLHPLSTPGTCCLIWEMLVLTSLTLHQPQLAPVTPAPLSFGECDSFGLCLAPVGFGVLYLHAG
ncbi:hypothetical protein CDAR_196201 [Caerostris darwini]|uniref:Uncharacterized protein n=1 Tax=Caerostris darwini TaxID=1538125 RepID=A0AAV4MI09_9ARAC|nr:hypothetical protein CDAR_196201 [Caerostris darwini]